jgi:insulysin
MTTQVSQIQVNRYNIDILKPKSDFRNYRHLTLKNGLEAVLISDPLTTSSGASLSVDVGANSDPHTLQGLAHFCEHMLFLGSNKYPDGELYFKTITENNGHFNAYTDREITNFFFDIHYFSFETALDIFSRFFIDPLFTKDKVDKEINSVNSEFEKNLIIDTRKRSQILTYISDPDNLFHRFSTGNIQTLTNNSLYYNIDLRDELLNYHSKYYTSDNMKLVLYSNDDLDDLEDLVLAKFSEVKPSPEYLLSNKHHKKKSLKEKETKLKEVKHHHKINSPYSKDALGSFIQYHSLNLENELTITFIQFPLNELFNINPFYYFSFIVESRDDDSLISILKRKQYISKLGVENDRNLKDWSDFTIVMDLTKEGTNNLEDILKITHAFLETLREKMVNKKAFEYLHKISKLNFEYGRSDLSLFTYLSKLAAKLQDYPVQHLLDEIHITHSFNDTLLESYAANLKLENSIITIPAKITENKNYTFIGNNIREDYEPWYRTNFTISKLNMDIIKNSNVSEKFNLPELIELKTIDNLIKNTFKCEDHCLELIKKINSDEPILLNRTSVYELWYMKEFTLNFNRTSVELQFDYNRFNRTEDRVNLLILQTLVKKKLKKIRSKLEQLANSIKISHNQYGLKISYTSFDVDVLDITKHIVEKVQLIGQKPVKEFDGTVQTVKDNLLTDYNAQPYSVSYDFLKDKLLKDYITPNNSLTYIDTITEARFNEFLKDFFENYTLKILTSGDLKESEALGIMNQFKPLVRNDNSTTSFIFSQTEKRKNKRRPILLQEGNYLIKSIYHQATNKNNALLKCYHVGRNNYKNEILIKLFHSIIGNIVFRELRINKQFGYIAKSKIDIFDTDYVNKQLI